jgi:tRNA(fMet)-specific endonuclease VapC
VATLIDASVLIAVERGRLDLDAVVAAETDEVIALATITASELLHGIHRAAKTGPARSARGVRRAGARGRGRHSI